MQATTVAAQGSAETDYNLAGFSISLSAEGASAPVAKLNLKKQVDELLVTLEQMRGRLNLVFVKDSIHTSTNVQENWQYNNNVREFLGFIASYSYFFQIDDMDKVSEVYDVLSSLSEATTSSPSFALKDATRQKLNKKALKNAFSKVTDRFDVETTILGLDAGDFEIASWEATYSDSHRSDRVAATTRRAAGAMRRAVSDDGLESASASIQAAPMGGGAPSAEPLEIVVGKAKVTANLEVGYARKVVQPAVHKATVVKASPRSEETTNV